MIGIGSFFSKKYLYEKKLVSIKLLRGITKKYPDSIDYRTIESVRNRAISIYDPLIRKERKLQMSSGEYRKKESEDTLELARKRLQYK